MFVTVTVTAHVTLLRPALDHVIGRPALRASPSNSMASSSSDARATPVKQPSKKSFPGDRKDRNAAHSRACSRRTAHKTLLVSSTHTAHRTFAKPSSTAHTHIMRADDEPYLSLAAKPTRRVLRRPSAIRQHIVLCFNFLGNRESTLRRSQAALRNACLIKCALVWLQVRSWLSRARPVPS